VAADPAVAATTSSAPSWSLTRTLHPTIYEIQQVLATPELRIDRLVSDGSWTVAGNPRSVIGGPQSGVGVIGALFEESHSV
jgi:hypothetical protein